MGKKIVIYIVATIWLAGFALPRPGQTGTITGVVKTAEGVSLPGVTVLLKSPKLLLPEIEDVTNAAGMYRFPHLPPGKYELTFILSGFQKMVKKNISVTAGTTVSLDIDHTLRARNEAVIVEGKEPRKEIPINL